jgi:hypothetical protein
MTTFEMIKYHKQTYPDDIPLYIEEIAAHFDVQKISGQLKYSLHTEYSYGKRKFNSSLILGLPEILASQKDGVPQLWKNELWALQFAEFILTLMGSEIPAVIEIHPPFDDYIDMKSFIRCYSIFENKIKEHFPKVKILIENRCGSIYRGGKFLISKLQDITSLCEYIEKKSLLLKIAYDIPQIYTAHRADNEKAYISLLEQTKTLRSYIGGVHLWGKRLSNTGRKVSHCGDLNSYFGNDSTKEAFLQAFSNCFDDNIPRKMVLEVNSGNDDLMSIISDLQNSGIQFI